MIAPALLGSEACRGKATGILYHLTVTLIEQQPYYQVLPSTTPYYNDLLQCTTISPKYFTPYCRTLFPIRNYLTRRAVAMVDRRVKVFKYVHKGSGREHEWLALSETGEIGYRSQNKAGALVWSGFGALCGAVCTAAGPMFLNTLSASEISVGVEVKAAACTT